jgi:hypothetical protein
MARVKCKYCEEFLLKKDALIIIEKSEKTGKEKNIYLHKDCESDYKELMEYKENEIKMFNEIYEYTKELLNYDSGQDLPSSLITRLQDLRNGTIIQRGVGRIVKSKDGYPYEVILDAFLSCSESIRWSLKNKTFENESNKINYMMAIINSNINDSYMAYKGRNEAKSIRERNDIVEEERRTESRKSSQRQENPKTQPKVDGGISKFLDEDDF